ncbi:MAG: DNA polymerase III subunit delta' [Actinobacteria bacterium HGW-Actinobacteria-6]|nr:MAG: DNA polymerase III subunit delta' [Actinobacteria bacterium HGW-Actinobacteria-6]
MSSKCVWDEIPAQTRVAGFLRSAVAGDTVSHAYLFVGPSGSGKKTAAVALACAVYCEDGGCGSCSTCHRVLSGHHPDVHVVRPEGAATYIVDQVREIIHDVNLKPVQASHKIYIIDEADRFNSESANAFLKTLEEPPDDVIIVLLTRSFETVLPTIASRCQVVRFRPVPPSVAAALLVERLGVDPSQAIAALAASGGVVPRAEELLRSPGRLAARELCLETLKRLPHMDGYDVIEAARALLGAVKAPLDEVKSTQGDEIEEYRSLLGKKVSTKPLEERHKRELTAREREGVSEILGVAQSWLRDCLAVSQGAGVYVGNTDVADAMEEVASVITPAAALTALEAVDTARKRISYNVSPQLAIEVMLFDIQEVLRCPR